ncbi:MAG: asparaginase, partial [Chloroflexota bacterium]|nr:asparaginase [Chloroflexota bacterium]
EIQVEEFSNVPSTHLTVEQMWQLQKTVSDRLERLYVRGVVVTHGTDTMEETAYLLDYTIPSDKAVVLTGAMRVASDPAYEGAHNLRSAIRVALDPESDGRGTMVVMNDEIHAARYVTKTMSHNPATFQSPGWGPMGRLFDEVILWGWKLEREMLPVREIDPDVHLLKATVGASDLLLRALIERRVSGIVIEALGAARVPPWWMDPIREAVEQGIAVVIATRTHSGYSHDRYGYPGAYRTLEEAGVIFANGLDATKARLRLMAALGALR